MLKLPPYEMHYPIPGRLEIRVKPRYWFALVVALLVAPQAVFYVWSYDAYCAFIAFVLSPLGEDISRDTARSAYTFFPLFIAIIMILCIAAHQLYKRHGLIEVTRHGVRIVRNTHFWPRGEVFVQHAEIAELNDEIFYVRFEEAGTQLVLKNRGGLRLELVKIWGRDRTSTNNYMALSKEIRNVLGAVGV